jgi:hypothetical protein
MAQPARERLLGAAATAEGSLRRGMMGQLTALLSQELPEKPWGARSLHGL